MLDVTSPHHLDSVPAHVTLVGAGPGDPELLTVKAVKALASAHTVLYDNLVSDDVLALCERIVVGQTDEIHLMQHWLRERGQEVPPEDAKTHKMKMNGMVHEMIMPGMLNAEQLAELDKARGSDFDRLFLKAMIGHHLGAIDMVNQLQASAGSGNDDIVYRFASDVYADQSTEVERMTKMLEATPGK